MITNKEYNELITLIINLRDEAVTYGQRLHQANSGAWINEEAIKYSEKQVVSAEKLIVDYLKGITKLIQPTHNHPPPSLPLYVM